MGKVVNLNPKLEAKKLESSLTRAIRIRLQLEHFKHLVSAAYYEQNVEYIERRIHWLADQSQMDGSCLLNAIYAKFTPEVPGLTLVE